MSLPGVRRLHGWCSRPQHGDMWVAGGDSLNRCGRGKSWHESLDRRVVGRCRALTEQKSSAGKDFWHTAMRDCRAGQERASRRTAPCGAFSTGASQHRGQYAEGASVSRPAQVWSFASLSVSDFAVDRFVNAVEHCGGFQNFRTSDLARPSFSASLRFGP